MSSKDIAMKLAELLNSKKAEDIVVIDIAEKSSFADFLVVASGTSDRHIESLNKGNRRKEWYRLDITRSWRCYRQYFQS